MAEAYDWAGDEIVKANQEEIGMAVNAAKAKGSKFIELTPEELELWADTMDPINQEWIKTTAAKGLPAQATFDKLFILIDHISNNLKEMVIIG
jgi:TRAP-type C4-dicarboxylate transport system substrate-binding protein